MSWYSHSTVKCAEFHVRKWRQPSKTAAKQDTTVQDNVPTFVSVSQQDVGTFSSCTGATILDFFDVTMRRCISFHFLLLKLPASVFPDKLWTSNRLAFKTFQELEFSFLLMQLHLISYCSEQIHILFGIDFICNQFDTKTPCALSFNTPMRVFRCSLTLLFSICLDLKTLAWSAQILHINSAARSLSVLSQRSLRYTIFNLSAPRLVLHHRHQPV